MAEATIFGIAESPTVSLEAMMRVCELIEKRNEKDKGDIEIKRSTLSTRKSKPRKGRPNEPTATLDYGRKGVQSNKGRIACPARGNRNHGRSDHRRCSNKKGGKR